MITWEMPKLAARRICVVVKLRCIKHARNNSWVKIISSAQWIVPLALHQNCTQGLSESIKGVIFQSYLPGWHLLLEGKTEKESAALNVLDFIKECEPSSDGKYSCMHGQPLFAMLHHTLILNWGNWLNREQISQLVNSAHRVQLHWIKGLSFLAFRGFIRCVTILRPGHRSSQHVNLRTDTQTLPPPSLSAYISLTSRTSPALTSAPPHFPL